MASQRSTDIASGLFLVALGAAVFIASLSIQSVFGEVLPPRTLPLALAGSTIFGGLVLSIRAYLYRGEEVPVEWPDRLGWMRLLVTIVSLLAYLVLIEPLGVALASLCFSTFLVWYLDRRILPSLCVGIAVALVIEYAFIRGLTMPLPAAFWAR
jgi:putative tricarboxylic transport membrane protein